jgi:hypothetical protein
MQCTNNIFMLYVMLSYFKRRRHLRVRDVKKITTYYNNSDDDDDDDNNNNNT